MKNIKNLLVLGFIICSLFLEQCLAENNYSNEAISLYNTAASLQNQGKYELAEQKYNQALRLQPNFKEARKNLGSIYYEYAYRYFYKKEYSKAIIFCKKSLANNPSKTASYDIMGRCYYGLKDYNNAISSMYKFVSLKPKDIEALHILAISYLKTNQNAKANEIYKKILAINPDDTVAKNNLKYADYQTSENKLNKSLNNLSVQHDAPTALYSLIKLEPGVPKEATQIVRTVLDLAWSEPNGRLILKELLKRKVNINIVSENTNANTIKTGQEHTLYAYGLVPLVSYGSSVIAVNIPVSYVYNFKNTNLSAHKRVYNLHVFIHEFGHAFMALKDPKNEDSLEEEVGVSIIGYNLASKVLTGEYLNQEQTQTYALGCLQAALNDDHRSLPVYSGFINKAQSYGILMPYVQIYSNLTPLYKQLLYDGKVAPVDTFNKYLKN